MKSNYHEKRESRIDSFRRLASSNEALSVSLWKKSDQIASVIPFGQPILVGHHSEKGDRNYRNKIHNTMGQSVEASKKADYYAERAAAAESNTAISSDNPQALELLTDKLQKLQELQELYKAINAIIRKKKMAEVEKVEALVNLGMKEETAIKLMAGDNYGRCGIPSYKLTNNNGNMARIKERITFLQRVANIPSSEEEINGVKMVVSQDDNRIQLFFPGKPSEQIRSELKSMGFHWAPSVGAWMQMISSYRINQTKKFLDTVQL